ncbi:PorP/SprF family type IX secretion system membrane protein [Fibrisoma limi]|nr:PorP/SprF family type IX secretion system membrane protein [Fibrisoma limi]
MHLLKKATFACLLSGFISLLATGSAVAQKEVLYSQYLVNPLGINPATAGSRESFHLTAMLRRKWIGLRNAPITQSVAADGAIANGTIGLGFQALNDRMGLFQATGAYGSVAYRFNMPALAKLSVGVQGGVSVLPIYDFTSASSLNRAVGSLSVGVYYQSDRYFGGISAPELIGKALNLSNRFLYQSVRPIMFQAGVKTAVAENVVLIPSVLVSAISGRPLGVDVNAKAWINERFGFGLAYRYKTPGLIQTNYVHATAELQLGSSIRVGYLFYSQTPENPYSTYTQNSTHEFMFRFSPNALGFSY